MEVFDINAEPREVQGKGASRRLRRDGIVPAVVYGAGKDPQNIQLNHNEVFLHTEHEAFYSHILNLNISGNSERVILRDMQRHPYKPVINHIDFQRIDESKKLTMRVPLHFTNEEQCVGVKQGGGIVSHLMTEIEIACLPKDLPEYIEIDIVDLDVGSSLHLSDIQAPAGVEIAALMHGGDPNQSVVSVQMPKVEVEVAPEEEVEAVESEESPAGEAPAAEDSSDSE